jgi:hypothetical protein
LIVTRSHGSFCRARFRSWGAPALLAAALVACGKPEKDLGLDLLPAEPLGTVTEVYPVRAYSRPDTALRTSGLSRQLVGSYLDPQFGSVRVGSVFQLGLSVNNIGAGQDNSGLVADSIVLALPFDLSTPPYGGLDPQVFQVFELEEALSVDSLYYNDRIPAHDPGGDLVAERGGRIRPDLAQRPVVLGDTLVPQLRIRLDPALADRFVAAFGQPAFLDNVAFQEFFKGIYLSVDNGVQLPFEQGILPLNLLSTAAKVTLYYRNTLLDPSATRALDFPVGQNSVRYTVVEHDRSQVLEPGLSEALADTTAPAVRTHVQALGGLRTGLRFPGLGPAAYPGRVLARAVLVAPIEGTFNPDLFPPTQLFVFRRKTTGGDLFLPDQLQGTGSIDGQYNSADRCYRFNITRYVQGLLNGSMEERVLELVPGSNGISAARAVLAGPAHPDGGMRLELTFTTF